MAQQPVEINDITPGWAFENTGPRPFARSPAHVEAAREGVPFDDPDDVPETDLSELSLLPNEPDPSDAKTAQQSPTSRSSSAFFSPSVSPVSKSISLEADDAIPDWAICPISREVMEDPVMVSSGQTFNKASIEESIKINKRCPITRETLLTVNGAVWMKPNVKLRHAIEDMLKVRSEKTAVASPRPVSSD